VKAAPGSVTLALAAQSISASAFIRIGRFIDPREFGTDFVEIREGLWH